jgi:hypothetical protein
MFKTKFVSYNTTITLKPPKTNNVLVNVIDVITIRNQQSEQQVFKERELVKIKWAEKWQQEELLWDPFIESIKLKHSGAKKQPTTINEGSLQTNWARLPNNPTMTQPTISNRISEVIQQLVISKQVTIKKTLEEILKDINKQVLETKFTLNLGQLLRANPNIKC